MSLVPRVPRARFARRSRGRHPAGERASLSPRTGRDTCVWTALVSPMPCHGTSHFPPLISVYFTLIQWGVHARTVAQWHSGTVDSMPGSQTRPQWEPSRDGHGALSAL